MLLHNARPLTPSAQNTEMPSIVASDRSPTAHSLDAKRMDFNTNHSPAGVRRTTSMTKDQDPGGIGDSAGTYNRVDHEIAELRKQMATLTTQLRQNQPIQQPLASHQTLAHEDGKNMANFIDVVELQFTRQGLEVSIWGEELSKYLKDEALGYWMYLKRTGTPLTDWELVRQQFCMRFCSISREKMIELMAANVWQGDHSAYSARFAAITAQSVHMPPEELAGFFMANLPTEQRRAVTQGGTRDITEWQEAAAALATSERPWITVNEKLARYEQQLAEARRRMEHSERRPRPRHTLKIAEDLQNHNLEGRCFECQGRGHIGKDCPLRCGVIRRAGETCTRCGGRDHYAKECTTQRAEIRQSRDRPPPTTTTREDQGSRRLNERA